MHRRPRPIEDLGELRRQVVEQVMRVSDCDADVMPWLAVGPGSPAAHRALGRLLAHHPFVLRAASPVAVWVSGREVDRDWRRHAPAKPGSLFAELTRLEQARPHTCATTACRCCPYRRLEAAREHAA